MTLIKDFNVAIAQALGFDPDRTGRITIVLEPEHFPIVTVEQFIPEENGKAMTAELKKYTLVLREELS